MIRYALGISILTLSLVGPAFGEVSVTVEEATVDESVPTPEIDDNVLYETDGECCDGDVICEDVVCDECPGPGLFQRAAARIRAFWSWPIGRGAACESCECACDPCACSCDPCEDQCKPAGLFQRWRNKFRHQECCEVADVCSDECVMCEGDAYSEVAPEVLESTADDCEHCGRFVKPAPARVQKLPVSEEETVPESDGLPGLPGKSTPIPSSDELRPLLRESTHRFQQPVVTPVESRRMAHAYDYSWLVGEIHFAHVQGGVWILRYLPLDETDAYGGGVVLVRDARLDRFQEGDTVRVSGEVLRDRSSRYLGGPLYRIHQISLVAPGVRNSAVTNGR